MLPASVRIFVCTTPQDMRRSFDALAQAARQLVGEDPQSGALFVFVGKCKMKVKILWWERNGYCLLYKRLHRALFVLPRSQDGAQPPALRIDGPQLVALLQGVEHELRKQRTNLH